MDVEISSPPTSKNPHTQLLNADAEESYTDRKMGKNNFQPVRKGKNIVQKWKKETHAQSEMEEGNQTLHSIQKSWKNDSNPKRGLHQQQGRIVVEKP